MHAIEHAYIRSKDGLPFSDSAFTLYQGLSKAGIPVTWFTDLDAEVLPNLTPSTLVNSGVGDVRKAVQALPYSRPPEFPTIPDCIEPLMGRRVWKSTMGEIRKDSAWPVFVKPEQHKLFTGYVIQDFGDLIKTAHIPDETVIWAQEPVEFLSEYRGFIHWDKLVGLRHYAGDSTIFPESEVISWAQRALARVMPLPTAYSIDLGVLPTGKTVVVEINDAFALGPYGLPWNLYAPMVCDRWLEMSAGPNEFAKYLVTRFLDRKITKQQFMNRFPCYLDHEHEDYAVSSAHLIWCEYTSWNDAPDDWLYATLYNELRGSGYYTRL